MADLLVKAVDASHPDPEVDRRGAYKKGDIVEVRETGAPRGTAEGLPTFVWVECPSVTKDTILNRMESWRYDVDWTVVGTDTDVDGARLRLYNNNQSPSGDAKVLRSRVEQFINRWNANVVSVDVGAGTVTFDMTVYSASISEGFNWPPTDVSFTEDSYNTASGVHQITADYSAHTQYIEDPDQATQWVASNVNRMNGTVVSNVSGSCTFTVTRADVRSKVRDGIKELADGVYRRRRFAFDPTQVDTVISNGGTIEVTSTQLANNVIDRMAQ